MRASEAFQLVRDIPYRIQLSAREADHSCSGKQRLLHALLIQAGYDVRYRVCEFLWSTLDLPPEVADAPHDDLCTHVYLEVMIDGEWTNVDPTWDIGLARVLPVNEWGKPNTIAVPVRTTLSVEKSAEIMAIDDPAMIEADLEINGALYAALNAWLEKVRTTNAAV